jgi:hypothetical protein
MANGLPTKGQVIDGFRYLGGDPNDEASWAADSGLKSGMVTDGYRYLGGDPNSEKSWQPVSLEEGTRGVASVVNDTVIEAANAVLGGVGAIADFVSPGNRLSQGTESLVRQGEESQSDIMRARKQAFRAELEGAEGFVDEAGVAARYALKNPGLIAAQAAGSYAVPGVAIKGVGTGARALGLGQKATSRAQLGTGVVVGGAMAGGDAGGQAYDLVMNIPNDVLSQSPEYQSLLEGGMEPQAAREKLATDAARMASAVPAAVGAAGGAVGVERLLSGGRGFAGGVLSRGAKTGAVEAVTEGFEEGVTGYSGRAAAAQYDPSIDPMKGVGGEAVIGAVTGFVPGAVIGGASAAAEPSRQRQLQAEQALREAPDAATAAAAANELAGSVADLEAAVDQYLTPGGAIPTPEQAAAMPAPQGTAPREDPTRAMIDRQAGLIAEAQAAGTQFDRQMALDQAQAALPQPQEGRSAGYVDLTPMNDMQAQQRLAILRDETARSGGNALALAIVPHPAQAGRFAIGTQALPDLTLPDTTPTIPPDQAQYQIESAALGGQVSQARAEDSATRGPIIDRALKNVEERGGVATPSEARIFQEAGIGQPYDRVDASLEPGPAPLIETAGAARESFTPNQQLADQEVQADQAARRQADIAQRDRTTQQQIAAANQPQPLPDAGQVISALVTPGRDRSAEQVRIINQARSRYDAKDFSILERAATAPFQLDTQERMRLRELRNPPAVPETSTIVPETGTGLMGTRVAERLGQPSNGRIVTTSAKFSTQRVDGTFTVNDGGTQHEVRVVEPGRMGTQGRLLQQIARIFGKRVIAFESDTLKVDGLVRDGDNKSIYVNANSSISPLAVFGHELTHQLKRDNPQAYAALESVVQRELGEGAMAQFEQEYGEGANLEEITSDLVGNRFQEADFWQSVFDEIAAQNPEQARGIVYRLAAAITRAVNAFMKVVRQPGFRADQYVKDLNAVKVAVRQALATYAQQQRPATEQAAEPAQPAARPSMAERLREAARTARTEMGETVTASPARNQDAAYNVSDTNLGAENARVSDTGGDRGVPADTGPDRSGTGEAGRGEIPSYGQPREGAVSVVGRHYSRAERQRLSGNFYGSGLRGAEGRRLAESPDPRLRQRIYFYVDKGRGIRPEAGVGSIAHEVRLDNIYDPSTRLIGPQEDANSFESAVINAGFDGYIAPFGIQDAVVLLGPKHNAVPVQRVGEGAQFTRRRREVPETIDTFARLEQVFPRARAGSFNTNRELKLSLQDAITAAAREAGVDLSGRSAEVEKYLVRVGVADALYAIRSNANAVGWYDKTVTKALKILGKLHPEINTDANAKFAFTWALAVTSNGQKVDKNFELAEAAYKTYKRTGRMPNNLQAGQTQSAINEGLELFNDMVAQYGIDNVRQFMDTKFLVSQIERATGLGVGGEFKETEVRGAAVLGPKIGNGFFSNLNGFFDQLTMDRWLMRTWGRWTGTLIERRPDMIRAKREELRTLVAEMKKNAPAATEFQKALGQRLTVGNPDALARAIQKASMDPATREKFNKTPVGESLRKTGNALAKYIDGQKESPAGPEERNFIRKVFAQILDGVRERGFASLTMSDLQALLWYPEKRLYDTAKSDESAQEGYADDEAPDYANAAAKLARANGVSNKDVQSAIREAEKEYETRERARPTERDTGDQQAQAPAQGGVRGFTEREKRRFLTAGIVPRIRSDRQRDEAAPGPYSRKGGGDGRGLRVLGQPSVAVYSPATKFKNALGEIPAAAPKFFELDEKGAALFQDAIQASKDVSPFGAAVYVYPLKDYQGMRLFLTDDAKAGFALKGDDIVSVFAGPEQRGAVNAIMQLAIQEGGRRLDAFDTVLPDLYSVHGFKIVARSQWDDQFAPEGWNKATFQDYNNGEPDVVFMVYDPTYFGAPSNTDGQVIQNYEDGAVKQREALGGAAAAPVVSTDPSAGDENLQFSRRRKPAPKKTVKAYKLFRVNEKKPGQLFPLFIGKNEPVEMGVWYDADDIPTKGFASRPGWHAGDSPMATHIGEKSRSDLTAPDTRPANQVWAEIEMSADRDWQAEANKRGTNAQGKIIAARADIKDQIPVDGFYRYKTNPNMTGSWLIGGSIKVNRILSDTEVERINRKAGVEDLPREAPFDAKKYGFGKAKLSRQREAQTEYAEVEARYRGTDQWLKAPNGEPTNLTERQWVQVRTPSFKAWFGDWEKYASTPGGVWSDAEGEVSKVVDANGEPLVVYHGTDRGGFSVFKRPGGTGRGDLGIFTTPDLEMAKTYMTRRGGEVKIESDPLRPRQPSMQEKKPGYYASFLNLRRPYEEDFEGANWDGSRDGQYQVVTDEGDIEGYFNDRDKAEAFAESIGGEVQGADDSWQSTDSVVREARGYADGAIIRNVVDSGPGVFNAYVGDPTDVYIAFEPNQLKSATQNTGEFSPESDDIRYSRQRNYGTLTAAQEQALRNVGGIVPTQTVGDRAKELKQKFSRTWFSGIFDQFAPLKDVDQRAYMLARLSKGSDGALEALMLYGKPFMNGDVPDVKVGDQGFINVMASLKGEHDRFLWWVAAQRAENLKAQGRENLFTDQDISSLKTLNQGNFSDGTPRAQAYASALVKMNEFNDAVLAIAEQSGLIDGQARQLFKDMPYVPFYRVMEGGIEGPSFSSGLVNQRAWKKLKGGTQKLNEDLLSNVLLNWAHLFDAAGKNRAAVASMQAATSIGIAQQVPAGTKDSVKVMEQGQTKHYTIDDPYIMEAVTSLNYQPPGFFQPFSTFKKWLTIGVTASPTFKIKNLIRDSLQAIGTTPLSYNVASNVMKGFQLGSQETQTFASMLAGGGLIRFGSMLEGTSRTQYMIERQGGILLNEGGWKKLQRQMTGLVEAYAEFGDRLENVNRAALYDRLIAKGYSQAEANFMARDLMDFSLQGRWPIVRFLAQSVPFLNARLQGLSKLGRGAKEDPRRFGYVVSAVAMASIALMLAYEDDEDWKKRPDWDRDTNWWFKIGDTAFRIPKPFEIGAIGTVAERTWEMAFNDEMTWKRYRARLSHMIFETFAMDPTPQLIVPISEIYANREGFTGRPIEGLSLQKLRPEDRATESTSSAARLLGQMGLPSPISLVKGEYEKLSPVQIDHLVRGYFGWLGTTASNIVDFGLRPLMDRGERPAYRLKDVFVVGNFAEGLPAGSSRYVDQLYDQARIIEQAYMSYRDAVKKGDRERAKELLAKEGDKIRAYKAINRISDQVSEINRKIRQIDASRTLSAETKRRMIDQLSQRKNAIAQRGQRFAEID